MGNGAAKEIQEVKERYEQKLQEAEERYEEQIRKNKERYEEQICMIEENCREKMCDKKAVETMVSELNAEIQAQSAKFERASKDWDMETQELLSQIEAARKQNEEKCVQNERVFHQYREENIKLQHQVSSHETEKKLLEEEKQYLQNTMDRRTFVSNEKQKCLERKVSELESLTKDLDSSKGSAMYKQKKNR